MSEHVNQNLQANATESDDPLAELARIVAGENPTQAAPPEYSVQASTEGVIVADLQSETAIGFDADLEQELLKEIAPAPVEVPVEQPVEQTIVQPAQQTFEQPVQQFHEPSPEPVAAPTADLNTAPNFAEPLKNPEPLNQAEPGLPDVISLEASLEDQLLHELQLAEQAGANSFEPIEPAAEQVVADNAEISELQHVEALAQELAIEAMPPTPAPEVPIETPFIPEPPVVADVPATDFNLEAEFETAFASELDQGEPVQNVAVEQQVEPLQPVQEELVAEAVPAAQSWNEGETAEAQLEFASAFPSEEETVTGIDPAASGIDPAASGPEHLDDPAIFDDAAVDDELGEPIVLRPQRSGIKMAALALGISLFAGFAAVGYGYFSKNNGPTDPIVVKADTGDIKVKPEDSGGKLIANQDKASYAELSGEKEETNQERLISGTEPAKQIAAIEPKVEERLSPSVDGAETNVPAAIAPRRVRTFTVKPDGTIIIPDPVVSDAPTVAALEAQEATRGLQINGLDPVSADGGSDTNELALAEPETPAEIVETGPELIDGAIAATGDIAIPEQSPLPKPQKLNAKLALIEAVAKPNGNNSTASETASSATQSTPTGASPWVVQISSQRSRAAADASFKNLQRKFPSLLTGRSIEIKQAQVSGKGTFFRVRVGTDSKQSAASFCTRYKSAGGSCFITR